MTSVLTPHDREQFEREGYVRVANAFPREAAAEMNAFMWSRMHKLHGIEEGNRQTWGVQGPWLGMKDFKADPVFEPVSSERLLGAIDELLSPSTWDPPVHWGGFLITFPDTEPGQWEVPTQAWHVDFHMTNQPLDEMFGLSVFTFFSKVEPGGGGTPVVTGSHRLVRRFVQGLDESERGESFRAMTQRFAKSHPWLAGLISDREKHSRRERFMKTGERIDGVEVRVIELTGEPGDAVLCHPWLFHTRAPNSAESPRFMRVKNIYRQGAKGANRAKGEKAPAQEA